MGRTIRLYKDEDHEAVRNLFIQVNQELAPPHMRAEFDRYIELGLREEMDRIPEYYQVRDRCSFWVAVDGAELLGTFGLEPAGEDSLDLRRFYVSAPARGQGVGKWMLQFAEQVAIEMGCAKLLASTSELQTAALALYRKAGYELLREEIATDRTSKQVGGGLLRYYFRKLL